MTDHELAVKMVRQGLAVWQEVRMETHSEMEAAMLRACIHTTTMVSLMKQLAAAISNKDVTIVGQKRTSDR